MISEQFMQIGRWDLRLSEDTPLTVREMLEPGSQIVITPTRAPFSGYPADGGFVTITSGYEAQVESLLESARYRGPILEVGNRRTELAGHGMLWYLGNGSGSGPMTYSTNLTARNWLSHLINFVDSGSFTGNSQWNGITRAAGLSLPAGTWPSATATDDDLPLNVLQRLTTLAERLGVEFYVDPQGNFQHCGSSAHFVTTPQVILMAGHEGRDLDLIGLRLVELSNTTDRWTATNYAMAYYKNSATSYTHSNTGTGVPNFDGADGLTYEYFGAGAISDSGGSYTQKLTELSGQFQEYEKVTATVDTYDPGRWMKPGDYLWAYDPISRIHDTGQATTYHGMHVTPAKLRLYGMDWSVRQGMGVYRLPSDFAGSGGYSPAVLDLTDYVEFEDSPCRLDLGARQRSYDQ